MSLLANSFWYLTCLPHWYVFQQAQADVEGTQRHLLLNLLRRHANTSVGQYYGFAAIDSVTEYQSRVPLGSYQEAGISYPLWLKNELPSFLAPWLVNLFHHQPRLLTGSLYWSFMPLGEEYSTTTTLPFFEEDPEFIGSLESYLIHSRLAVPSLVRWITEIETFYYVTLLFLLRSPQLTTMLVWNPVLVMTLMRRLLEWWPRLATDLHNGTLTPNTPLPLDLQLRLLTPPHPRRALQIMEICQHRTHPASIYAQLWPKLRWINCWTDTYTRTFTRHLKKLFPNVRFQEQGIIAAEGVIAFPFLKKMGAMLAIRSHFFEFLPLAGGPVHLAHQLDLGHCYEVIITSAGGLYRYRLYDLVKVVGYCQQCPLVRFLGKTKQVSDWFGEKLSETAVRRALTELLTRYQIHPTLVMMACEELAGHHVYTLFIETSEMTTKITLLALAQALEIALQEANHHYRYCRQLGYLQALQVFRIKRAGLETYLKICFAQGQRIEEPIPLLHQKSGWSRVFQGELVCSG